MTHKIANRGYSMEQSKKSLSIASVAAAVTGALSSAFDLSPLAGLSPLSDGKPKQQSRTLGHKEVEHVQKYHKKGPIKNMVTITRKEPVYPGVTYYEQGKRERERRVRQGKAG